MNRVEPLVSARLLTEHALGLLPCLAGLDTLGPRVPKLRITTTATNSKPRTAETATTSFARFLDGAAFGACSIGDRRRSCCGERELKTQRHEEMKSYC